jgi:hypothetical protein
MNWKYLLGIAVVSSLPFAASANTIVADGNFSEGVSAGSYTTYGAGQSSTAIGPWTVSSGTVDLIGNLWQGPTGGGYSLDRAFGWQSKKADEQRGKEIARQPPAKMLK